MEKKIVMMNIRNNWYFHIIVIWYIMSLLIFIFVHILDSENTDECIDLTIMRVYL